MLKPQIAVVIPTYNNPKTIAQVTQDVLDQGYPLIIVDDGSTIPVASLVDNDNISIIRHPKNMGKGAAILSGAEKARELGYRYFVSMDGDGQHLAAEVSKLAENIDNNSPEQIILGARDFNIDNIPTLSRVGRAYHNFWIRLNSRYRINDSLTGFRLYPVSILDLGLKTRRFDFEVEVLVRHVWKYRNISERLINCYYPTTEERVSHFDNVNDTISITLLHLQLFACRYLFIKGLFPDGSKAKS